MRPFVSSPNESLDAWKLRADAILEQLYKYYSPTRFSYHLANLFGLDEIAVMHHLDFLMHGVQDSKHSKQGNDYFLHRIIPHLYYSHAQDYALAMRILSRYNIEHGLVS